MDSINLDPRIDELLIVSNMTEIDGIAIIDNFDKLTDWPTFNKLGPPPKKRWEPEIDEIDGNRKLTNSLELQ